MLKVMMALEFGALEKERRSPWMAMALSGVLFLVGALPPVVPFFFVTEAYRARLGGDPRRIGLFAVGWVKSVVTRAPAARRPGELRRRRRWRRGQLPHRESVRARGVADGGRRTADPWSYINSALRNSVRDIAPGSLAH